MSDKFNKVSRGISSNLPEGRKVDFGKMKDSDRVNLGASLGGGIGFEAGGPAGSVIGAAFGANIANGVKALRDGTTELNKRKQGIGGFLKNSGFKDLDIYGELNNFSTNPLNGKSKRMADELDVTNPLSSVSEPIARAFGSIIGRGNMGFIDSENDLDVKALDSASGMISNMLQNGAKSPQDVIARAKDMAKKLKVTKKSLSNHVSTTTMPEEDKLRISQGIKNIFGE